MADLETNFNIDPYYDDFAKTKKFYRIIFRPAKAVQARELTQLQTIFQNQISSIGDFLFKDGAVVDGCALTYRPKFDYVNLVDNFTTNTSLTTTDLDNTYVITNSANSTLAVRAKIVVPKTGYILQYPDCNRLYVDYISTGKDGSNNDVSTFQSGDTLYVYDSNQGEFDTLDANNLFDTISVVTANATVNATGQGYGISVADGIVYQKGHFLLSNSHTIVVKDYDTNPDGYVVGFNTEEEIIKPETDSSLYDGSLGYPNNKAPGAHRLKLNPTLIAKEKSNTSINSNFFAVAEFDNYVPTEENIGQEGLATIIDYIAERTQDVSGDFTVKPHLVEPRQHASNTSLIDYEISAGVSYVKGYRVEKINSFRHEVEKATTTKEHQAQILTMNYGNYIEVDEVVGVFDFDNLDEVVFYDTAQNSVSEYEGAGTAPSGNIIGYANIKDFVYSSGTKGTPNCKFKMYLFNIRMNDGKAFSNIKSIYATSALGNAKADAVLTDSKAVINDVRKDKLVWPIGVNAVKRLRDSGGVNETQYVFRDISSATLGVDGNVTFTLNAPYAGGNERLNFSTGILSDSNEQNFNIILGSAAYSANLAGTMDLTNANGNLIVGSSTTFAEDFVVGDMVRINASGTPTIRRITAIANNTQIAIDADVSDANTAAAYQKYYPQGHVINTSDFDGTINVVSNTQFTVDTNLDVGTGTLDSGTQTVYAQYQVLRTQSTQANKDVTKNRFVKIDCSNNAGGTTGPWDLGVVDVSKVRNIYVGADYDEANPERTTWFTIDNGQRDTFYDHGRLILNTKYKDKITTASRILVELDYFTANTTAGIGFFSVDSYPIDDANTSNSSAIQTAEIPVYFSDIEGGYIDLRNSIDFRPRKYNTVTPNADANSAPVNPAVSNTSFNVPTGGQYLADVDSNFQADLETYLGRVDYVTMNRFGDIDVRKGVPNEVPLPPRNEGDTVVLARVNVSPYPTLSVREANSFGRSDLACGVQQNIIKRSTQYDIGQLKKRISALEYYTALNNLEQRAKDMLILDENGLDRFKNGIYADPFKSHKLGAVYDIEYACSVDPKKGLVRPKFITNPVDFQYANSESSGVVRTNNFISLPYSNVLHSNQRFTTKFRNCCESFWQWNGHLNLYPNVDHFRDEVNKPAINVNLDLNAPWEQFVNSPFGTNFGEWRITQDTTVSETERLTRDITLGNGTVRTVNTGQLQTTTTRTTESERFFENLSISDIQTDEYNIGTYVSDFAINPFMRSKQVSFICTGMKPNTKLHAFFDNVNVDAHVAPAALSGNTSFQTGMEDKILERNGDWGDTIASDSSGTVRGIFRIPDGTFRVGERQFLLTNVSNIVTGKDSQITRANALYTASNLMVEKGSATITTVQPNLAYDSGIETRTDVDTTVSIVTPPRNPTPNGADVAQGGGRGEPIAQSFPIVVGGNNSGLMMSQVGLYFQSKHPDLGVTVFVCETRDDYPHSAKILGKAYLDSSDVSVDATNGLTETVFSFDFPIFLNNHSNYAFIVWPEGNNSGYNIWMSEIGTIDVNTDEQVYRNPHWGNAYISSNFVGWTALQREDIKHNLYRAEFTVGSGTAVFNNEDDEFFTVDGFTKANTSLRVEVGDVVVKLDSGNNIISDSANTDYSYGRVQASSEADSSLYLDSSVGNWEANNIIEIHRPTTNTSAVSCNTSTLIATSTIESIDDLEYHAVVPRFATLEPAKTSLNFTFKGSTNAYSLDSSWINVMNNEESELFDHARYSASKSNEVALNAEAKTSKFQATLETSSGYVSPIIDLRRKSSLFVKNIINNDITNEHTKYGNALARHISKNSVLGDVVGSAEDLNVWLTAWRPVGTDVHVYAKLRGADDSEPIDNILWTKMIKTDSTENVYSSELNQSDYIEYKYRLPTANIYTFDGSDTSANTTLPGATGVDNSGLVMKLNTNNLVVYKNDVCVDPADYTANSTHVVFDTAIDDADVVDIYTSDDSIETSGKLTTAYLNGNDIVEYVRADGGKVETFKTYAFKVVMTAETGAVVPRLKDERGVALQK